MTGDEKAGDLDLAVANHGGGNQAGEPEYHLSVEVELRTPRLGWPEQPTSPTIPVMSRRRLTAAEGVTVLHPARLESPVEPLGPLLRAAVGQDSG